MNFKSVSMCAAVLVIGLAASSCAPRYGQLWNQSNEYEGEGLGDSVRQTYAQQIVNPDAVKYDPAAAAMDGQRMTKAVSTYKTNSGAGAGDKSSGGKTTVTVSAK
jgi:type IV pilus biogenesis protein CpaD/CtpE